MGSDRVTAFKRWDPSDPFRLLMALAFLLAATALLGETGLWSAIVSFVGIGMLLLGLLLLAEVLSRWVGVRKGGRPSGQ